MNRKLKTVNDYLFLILLIPFLLIGNRQVQGGELSGYVAAEANLFAYAPVFTGQERHSVSVSLQPEYYHESADGNASFTFTPFLRLDSADKERTNFDIRELFGLWVFNNYELSVGFRKVFWGVAESQHLVDIVNQTDLVDAIDGEEKLGQPMINISIPTDWGILDFFVLPYFRERTFQGKGGRLRTPLVVDTDQAIYESNAEEYHTDVAFRWSHSIGDWELGASYFRGTGREPTLLIGADSVGNPVLLPFYEQIDQAGLELQRIIGEWLWELEAIVRSGQGDTYGAWTGGFEYTFVGIGETKMDLGALVEWSHDTRGNEATTPFEDDILLGFRLAVNDIDSTEALIGIVQDIDTSARSIFIESNRRVGDHVKAIVEAYIFLNQPVEDRAYALRDDDFIQFKLAYYF